MSDLFYRDFGCKINRVIERHGRSEITMVEVVDTIEKSAGKWAKFADAALPFKLVYSGNNGLLYYMLSTWYDPVIVIASPVPISPP